MVDELPEIGVGRRNTRVLLGIRLCVRVGIFRRGHFMSQPFEVMLGEPRRRQVREQPGEAALHHRVEPIGLSADPTMCRGAVTSWVTGIRGAGTLVRRGLSVLLSRVDLPNQRLLSSQAPYADRETHGSLVRGRAPLAVSLPSWLIQTSAARAITVTGNSATNIFGSATDIDGTVRVTD